MFWDGGAGKRGHAMADSISVWSAESVLRLIFLSCRASPCQFLVGTIAKLNHDIAVWLLECGWCAGQGYVTWQAHAAQAGPHCRSETLCKRLLASPLLPTPMYIWVSEKLHAWMPVCIYCVWWNILVILASRHHNPSLQPKKVKK